VRSPDDKFHIYWEDRMDNLDTHPFKFQKILSNIEKKFTLEVIAVDLQN